MTTITVFFRVAQARECCDTAIQLPPPELGGGGGCRRHPRGGGADDGSADRLTEMQGHT
jgi:hypothetical protein